MNNYNIFTNNQQCFICLSSFKDYSKAIFEVFKFDGLKEGFGTLGDLSKGFFTSFAGSATLGIATFFAMKKAIEALSDAYNLSYDSAIKNTEANVNNFKSTKTEIEGLESNIQQYKDTLSSLGEKYEVDLSGIESIDDMITKLRQSGKLELTDEIELQRIDSQNASLERQLAIKNKLIESQQKLAAADAKDALGRGEQSVAQQVAQFVPGGKKTYQGMVNNVNILDAVNENIAAIQEYENAIADAENAMKDLDPNSKAWKEQEENINSYNEAIEKLTSDLNTKEADLSTLLSALSVDGEGLVALEGYENEFNAVKDAINNLNNMSLTPLQQEYAKIESFFDGSSSKNALKDKLLEIAKSEKPTQTVSEYLESIGVNLKAAGLDAVSLDKYFSDMAKSASDTADATEKVNNNLTISDIDKAFESANAGDNYVKLADYMKKAKELYDQGLVGTDDFKSVAEMFSYDQDDSVKAFEESYKKIKSYFKEDKDGNLTGQGVHNFLLDLQELNKGYAAFNKETGKWDINMDNTAQAAKELGIGVGVFESILGRIKDYDNVGDFNFVSAVEEFSKAKSSLDGIQSVMENLEDGDRKNALEEKLKKWSPLIEKAEEDLASLPDEIVTELKFEYNLAEIQKLIDELNNKWEQGDRSAETGAARNVAKEQYREERERQTGYTEESDKNYASSYTKIDELSADFGKATTDKARQDLQEQISAIMEMQNAFQDALANGEEVDWETFINSDHAKELMQDLVDTGEVTKSEIMDILGVDISMPVHFDFIGEATPDKIKAQMENLDVGSTITFTANLDGVEKQVRAIKNEDGTITYELIENGEGLDLHKDGTVTYKSGGQEQPKPLSTLVSYLLGIQESPHAKDAEVDYERGSQEDPLDRTAYVTYRTRAGGSQLGGTAYASGTMQDTSWLKDKWRTKKSEVALTGEEGQELVATRDGYFYTVGDKGAEFRHIPSGSVVFDAKQTKELLSKGHINSRGRSRLSGTAYLGSASGSFSFEGKASRYNTSSKLSNKNTTVDTTDKTTKQVDKALEELEKAFDLIVIKFERLARASEKAEAAIERARTRDGKLAKTDVAITKVRQERNAAEKGAADYLDHAKKIALSTGLSKSVQKQIQNGSIRMGDYNENTQKKISAYKEAYDNYLAALDKAVELQDKENELALQRLDIITESYDALKGLRDAGIDLNNSKLELMYAEDGNSRISEIEKIYKDSITKAKRNVVTSENELKDFEAELKKLVHSGQVKKETQQYYELLTQQRELEAAVYESKLQVVDLEQSLREKCIERLDEITEFYDAIKSVRESLINLNQSKIDLMEAKGASTYSYDDLKAVYSDSIAQAKRNRTTSKNELAAFEKEFNKLVASKHLKKDDKEYKELEAELNNLRAAVNASELEILELEEALRTKAIARIDEISDFYDALKSVADSIVDLNNSQIELLGKKGFSTLSEEAKAIYRDSIEQAKLAHELSVKQAEAFEAGINELIAKGEITEDDIEYYELQVELNNLKKAVVETEIAFLDLESELANIEFERIQNFIDALDRASNKLNNQISLMEARDEEIPESKYQEQINLNNEQLEYLSGQLDMKRSERAEYDVESPEYKRLSEEIAQIEDEMYGLLIQNEELKDSIVETRFADVNKDIDDLNRLQSEISDTRSMLDSDDFFDDDGNLTSEGVANITLITEEISLLKQETAECEEALRRLEEAYASGAISEKEYNEMSEEYRNNIRDNAKQIDNLEDSLEDLAETQMEKQREALKEQLREENELLQKNIEKRKEALQRKKDYYDYDTTIKQKSRDINMLRAQIAAMEGV